MKHIKRKCEQCKEFFKANITEVNRGRAKFCNRTCYYKSRLGKKASTDTILKMKISMIAAKSIVKVKAKERFKKYIHINPNGCWDWTAALYNSGYGAFSDDDNRAIRAHRFSYQIYKGIIPPELQIDHLCRNRKCVNPNHLEAVTPRENLMRSTSFIAINANKTNCIHGHDISKKENYYLGKKGNRQCKKCTFIRCKNSRLRKRCTSNTS